MSEPAKTKKSAAAPPAPAPAPSTESATSSSGSTATDTSASTSSGSSGGKSSRESIGGTSAVHYGFFSNIKSPEYKSGWDDIWGKKSGGKKKATATKKTTAKTASRVTRKPKEPVFVNLTLADLSEELRDELESLARTKLKKSRVNYDNRDKAGAISWRIECEVRR
jgi:hypothetical protein